MTGVPIKTSKYDFSLPTRSARSSTAPKSSKSNASSKGKKPCYYYYIYRKKINPLDIKSPNDLPIPLMFRSKNVKFEQVTENDDISMQVGSTRNLSPIKRNPAPKSTNKRHTRSSSLPDLKKQSREQLPTVQSKHKSILKSQSNTPRASNPLPRITTTAVSPSSSLSKSDGENLLKSGISVPSLLNLIPVDGMQWSRHTTITKTPTGVSEKTINVETRKIKRDGKWVEESIKMTTIKDQTGSRTQSTKSSFRALKPEEIDALITDGNHRPSSAPIPSFNSAGPERPSASQSNSAVKNVKAVDVSMSKPTFKLSRRTLTTSASYIAAMDNKKAQEIFAQEVLEAVNGYRKLHKVDLLTLSIQLKKRASEWAENLAKLERMEHGKQENFGENIYCKTSSQPWFPISGGEVVDNWYSEIEEHNFEEEPTQGYLSTGHFTQLIWSDTREMGVAYARNRNGHMAFVVSYFSPKGNWIGDFSKKVPPPGLHNVGKEEVKAPVGSQSESSQNRRRSFVNFPKSTRPTSEVNSQISTPSTGNSEGSILSARKIADISHSPGNIASNTSNPENSLSITSSPQNSASTITLPVNSVKSTSYLENSSGRKQSLDDSSATKVLLKNSDSKSAGKSSVSTFLVENSLKKSSENVYSSKVSQQNLTSYNLSQKNSQSSTISPENSSSKHSPKTVVDTKKTSTNSNIKDTSSSRLSPANSASTTTSTTANARSKLSGDSQQRKFSGSSSPSGDSEAPIVIARAKDIIPRKIFKDGEWYEQKEEQIFKYKSNGKVFHKVKISETPYNASEETLSDLEEIESNPSSGKSSTKTFAKFLSRHGRSLIQDDQEVFCKEVVEKINSYRQMHAVRHVKLSQSLCLLARERAKYFAYSSKINFSNRYDIGESIFIKELLEPFKKISGEDIVEKWYSEIELHNFENYSNIIAVNFTQMVWQATKEVGAAIERSPDGQIAYAVACYYPKGNFPGEHVKQVAPVGGFAYRPRNEKGIIQPNVAVKTDNFVKGVMRAMNYYRLQHGTISLLLDKTLTEYAQEWADQLAQEDQIRSRPSNIYGENIYRSSVRTSINISGQEPVKYWYRKKRFYNFSKPGDIRAAPFTQLVWQDCREVGLGMARSTSDHIYVVANFNPPGNMVGQFEEQVGHLQWR